MAVSVATFASGCSDSSGQAQTVATSTTAEAASTTTTVVGSTTAPPTDQSQPDDTTTESEEIGENSSSTDPQSVILSLADLPPGWAQEPDESDDEESDCTDAAAGFATFLTSSGNESAYAIFSQTSFGPFLIAGVAVDVPRADELFDVFPEALGACDGYVDADGFTTSVLPLSFPNVGDDTFAARIDLDGVFPVSVLYVLARKGDTIVLGGYAGFGGDAPDVGLLESSLRTMIDRV